MDKEAENDWGAYSGGKLLTDKTLYNIRRERRCEMLAEALRNMDVCRWRAMDQLITSPYVPQGFHLWNTPMEHWYDNSDGHRLWYPMVQATPMYRRLATANIFAHSKRHRTR